MTDKIHNILGINDIYKAPDKLMEILLDKPRREAVFLEMLELFEYKLDVDFWHGYYQEEAADRKVKKQDFTPMSVARLASTLTDGGGADNGMRFEATAGTGGMTIAKWHQDRCRHNPCHPQIPHAALNPYYPSAYFYECEELSDRAFPFLIFNMAIRGMNGAAVHCDSLARDCFGVFYISNGDDNPIGFSDINVMPYSNDVSKRFNVRFVENRYPAHVETAYEEE
jgi:hypothetical protein